MRSVLAVAYLAVAVAACGDDMRAKAHSADVASFDHAWTTVRDRHFDPTFGGVDWEGVRRELRPRVEAAKDRAGARAVIREMLARLQQSHFAIIETGDDQGDDKPDTGGTFGLVGLDVRIVGGDVLVARLDPGGPGDREGVKLGWRIDAIDGKTVDGLLAAVRQERAGSTMLQAEEYIEVMAALSGSTRTPVEIVFADGTGRSVTKSLERDSASDQITTYGNVTGLVEFQSAWVGSDEGVGYIRVGAFLDPATVMNRYRVSLAEMKRARGVVIDLRGNGGGLGTMASGMIGELVRRESILGIDRSRENERKVIVNPQPHPYDGPVAVLVDELSMSASEVLAAGVQELARGRVIGRPTPGAVLASAFERLPNGDTLQYAYAEYVTSKGRKLEGNGVQPDEVVALTRADLLSGKDAALDAAVAWIEQGIEKETPP